MAEVMSVDPFCCRMWEGHARLEEHINEKTCRSEIDSFLSFGQQLPVLARTLKGDVTHQYELVYGARRLFVARHLNVPLLLEIRQVTDREATVALDIENRQRKEFSPYERGLSYIDWLRTGLFSSQEELSRTLNVSPSQVSRLIRLAQLPPVILNAFPSPLDICETWGRNLMELWDDPVRRPAMTALARTIAKSGEQQSAAVVFQSLIQAPDENRSRGEVMQLDSHDEVVKDPNGCPLFRVRQHRKDTALLLPTSSVTSNVLSEIIREVAEILHRARAQLIDFESVRPDNGRADLAIVASGRMEGGTPLRN